MLDGRCLSLIADAFLAEAGKLPRFPKAIGGLTMGADFIVAAVTSARSRPASRWSRAPSFARSRRSTGPGTRSRTSFRKARPSWWSTTSLPQVHRPLAACDAFVGAGYDIVGIVALVDRESGGCEALARKYDCPVGAIFRKRDFPRIDREMDSVPDREDSL